MMSDVVLRLRTIDEMRTARFYEGNNNAREGNFTIFFTKNEGNTHDASKPTTTRCLIMPNTGSFRQL